MSSRREFLQGAGCAALPAVSGLVEASPVKGATRRAASFHVVAVDEAFAQSCAFAARLAAAGETVQAIPAGDPTRLWLQTLAPAWRRAPVPVAGMTQGGALLCLEQLAWSQGLRVIYHAEHIVAPGRPVRHVLHRDAQGAVAGALARGPLWPTRLADRLRAYGAGAKGVPPGPSVAGLLPPLRSDEVLLSSWIIGPARI